MSAGVFDVRDRVVIVTGGSSGLGERFARVLAEAGAQVVAAARRTDRLERLAADVDGVLPCTCDVQREEDLAALVAFTVDRLGPPQVVINNAGISVDLPAEDEPPSEFRRVMDVNLHAAFVLSQLTARHMLDARGGSIINVASMFGLVASAPINQASYCASKGGLVHLTRELGAQWARRGVRVNAIAPGFFETEISQEVFADERSMKWLRRNTPMGRPGDAHELDGVLLFLASDASSYVTGQTIAVDGGWTAR